jgi:hypothetical protein
MSESYSVNEHLLVRLAPTTDDQFQAHTTDLVQSPRAWFQAALLHDTEVDSQIMQRLAEHQLLFEYWGISGSAHLAYSTHLVWSSLLDILPPHDTTT